MKFLSRIAPTALIIISPLDAIAASVSSTSVSSDISTSSTSAQTTISVTPTTGFEVDVIYPLSNATYNLTDALPIVFALQNISAIQSAKQFNGQFTFYWGIMPFGNVGGEQEPGGVYEDSWSGKITSTLPVSDPYILINTTNVLDWDDGPFYPSGSVYQLQFALIWLPNTTTEECGSTHAEGQMFFNINLGDPEPDLLDVPQCPQFGAHVELNTNSTTSCPKLVLDTAAGNPCAVKVDQAMASSISSVAQYSATYVSTSTAPTASATKNAAPRSTTPGRSFMAVACIIASLELAS